MNSSEELAKKLKKKFNKMINEGNVLPDSPNMSAYMTPKKKLTWSGVSENDDSKPNKSLRVTPYPISKTLKKQHRSNSVPKYLTFTDSDSELLETSSTTLNDKSKNQCTKREQNWTVSSCKKIKPDVSNQSFSKYNSEEHYFCNDTILSPTIIFDYKGNTMKMLNICTSDDNSSDSEVEKLSKQEISNLNKYEIITPKVKLPSDYTDDQNSTDSKEILPEMNPHKSFDDKQKKKKGEYKKVSKVKLFINDYLKSFTFDNYCIIFIRHPIKLYFHGKLTVTVLSGAVEVLGHILKDNNKQKIEMYSPRGNCHLCLETVGCALLENIRSILKNYMPKKEIKEYLDFILDQGCILLIQNLNNSLTNYLSKHVAQYLFPKPIQCQKLIEKKLHCLFEIKDLTWKVYRKNENWSHIVKTSLKNLNKGFSCTMLCGGKSVGKSVLLRYMINSLLNKTEKVVCIDLDIGQAEFTIGGCISVTIIDKPIFGPNFTHLKTPEKSFFIGDVNVIDCIDRYISSVKKLLTYCNQNINKNIPWIVNCMGFSKSLGTDLTVSIIKLVNPNTVVQINSSTKSRNYQSWLTVKYVKNYIYSFPIIVPDVDLNYKLKSLDSVAEEKVDGEFQGESRHLRELSILSYFSQLITKEKEITSVTPYGIKLSAIKLHDLNYFGKNIPAALNGNLVALCNVTDNDINDQTIIECFGFGIVRGIDLNSEELYLLTPVAETQLDNINSLIRGNINLPPSLYMTTGRQGLVPYILLGKQAGTASIPKRTYINLKSLLKKKRSL